MATFVPQIQSTLPQIESFTPNYEFIQQWMATKQGRYNTALNELNSIYSTLKNLPLTLDENIEKRDQFFRNAEFKLKAIANTDLSLPENQRAAKLVFNPLATDEALVEDYGITGNAISVYKTAESFRNSGDEETRARYNPYSIQYANLTLEEYKNATPERRTEIASKKLRHVDNVNVMQRATEIAKEMDLDVTMMEPSPGGGYYNIKKRNGELITGSLLAAFNGRLMSDPLVTDYFNQRGYVHVQSELMARAQEIGYDAAQAEMIQQYVINPQVQAEKQAAQQEASEERKKLAQRAGEKEKLARERGIVPGTDEEEDWNALLQYVQGAEQTEATLERVIGPGTYDARIENAYSYAAMALLNGEISDAAQVLSMKNAEYTYEADPYKKMQVEHNYALDMEQKRFDNQKALKEFEWLLENGGISGQGVAALQGEELQDIFTTVNTVDENGEIITDPFLAQKRNLQLAGQVLDASKAEYITAVYDALVAQGLSPGKLNPAGLTGEGLTADQRAALFDAQLREAEDKLQNSIIANNLPAANLLAKRQKMLLYVGRISAADAAVNADFRTGVDAIPLGQYINDPQADALYRRYLFNQDGTLKGQEDFVNSIVGVPNTTYTKAAEEVSTWDWISGFLREIGKSETQTFPDVDPRVKEGRSLADVASEDNAKANLRKYYRDMVAGGKAKYNSAANADVRSLIDQDFRNFSGAGTYQNNALAYTFVSSKKARPENVVPNNILKQIYAAKGSVVFVPGQMSGNGGIQGVGIDPKNVQGNGVAETQAAFEHLYREVMAKGNRSDAMSAPSFTMKYLEDALTMEKAGMDKNYTAIEITMTGDWLSNNVVTDRSPNRPIKPGAHSDGSFIVYVPSEAVGTQGVSSVGRMMWNQLEAGQNVNIPYPGVADLTFSRRGSQVFLNGNVYQYDPATGRNRVAYKVQDVLGNDQQPVTAEQLENLNTVVWNKIQQQEATNFKLRQDHRDSEGIKPR